MENLTAKINVIAQAFTTYRSGIERAIQDWTLKQVHFDLQGKLYKTLWELNISLDDMQNNTYINRIVFWPDDTTYLVVKNIEKQIEDVFATNKTHKTVEEIYEEKATYINSLDKEKKEKYSHLMSDPLFYILLWWTYPLQSDKWTVTRVIDEQQLAKDLIENSVYTLIQDYRKIFKDAKNDNDLFITSQQFINTLYHMVWFTTVSWDFEYAEPDKYIKFFEIIWYTPKDERLIKDPIISIMTWWSPSYPHKDICMVDDKVLTKAILEISQ